MSIHPMLHANKDPIFGEAKQIAAKREKKCPILEEAMSKQMLHSLLTPNPIKEGLERTIDEIESVNGIDKRGEGVYVQASTVESLEALLEFLKTPAVDIPVRAIGLGPVCDKDVMKASIMLEKKKEYGTILAFDVKVTPAAREHADVLGVKIFTSAVMHDLLDQFMSYMDNVKEPNDRAGVDEAVFPCILELIYVYNNKGPIVMGVHVIDGIVKVGTPLCVWRNDMIDIGQIVSIQYNHRPVDFAKRGQKVAIKIIGTNAEERRKMFGRHFCIVDKLMSRISRRSLDALKENFADEIYAHGLLQLLFDLKVVFQIP